VDYFYNAQSFDATFTLNALGISHSTVLPAHTAVPRCMAAIKKSFRNIDYEIVLDRRVTQGLPANGRVRLLFESICNDAKKGAIVTRFYSQPVDVKHVQP
jgi:hypothetical protein